MRYLILLVLLTSCGSNWHLRRAIKKDPSILQERTTIVHDTILVQGQTLRDTTVLEVHDTIVLTNTDVIAKVIRSYDTITLEATCITDTIIVEKIVTEHSIQKPKERNWILRWALWFAVIAVIVRLLRRR